ncbi:MAG: hypothetical protein HY062_01640 [Bacteroidetes bacterium]|nr:hypothetical protein [Bacteroidota bacterium]
MEKYYTKVGKSIFGHWYFEQTIENYRTKIIISINSEKLIINWYIAGIYKEGIEISSNAHWYGDFLCFTEGQKYFVTHADEKILKFGEFSQLGVVGLVKWEYEFQKMAER